MKLKKSNFNSFNESFTAFCTFKKLLDLGRFDGGNFSQNSTSLHMFGQISIARSATDLLSTHLVAQKKRGYLLVPVTLSKSSLFAGLSWRICHIPFRVALILHEVDSTAVFNAPWRCVKNNCQCWSAVVIHVHCGSSWVYQRISNLLQVHPLKLGTFCSDLILTEIH